MTKEQKIIEKQELLLTYLFREYGDRFNDDNIVKKLKSDITALKQESEGEEKESDFKVPKWIKNRKKKATKKYKG